MCIIVVLHHHVEQVLGDGEEEPVNERLLDPRPIGVKRHGRSVNGAVDVLLEMELMEDKMKVSLQCVIRRILLGETNGHTGKDVDVADVFGRNRVADGKRVLVVRGAGHGGGGGVGGGWAAPGKSCGWPPTPPLYIGARGEGEAP